MINTERLYAAYVTYRKYFSDQSSEGINPDVGRRLMICVACADVAMEIIGDIPEAWRQMLADQHRALQNHKEKVAEFNRTVKNTRILHEQIADAETRTRLEREFAEIVRLQIDAFKMEQQYWQLMGASLDLVSINVHESLVEGVFGSIGRKRSVEALQKLGELLLNLLIPLSEVGDCLDAIREIIAGARLHAEAASDYLTELDRHREFITLWALLSQAVLHYFTVLDDVTKYTIEDARERVEERLARILKQQ